MFRWLRLATHRRNERERITSLLCGESFCSLRSQRESFRKHTLRRSGNTLGNPFPRHSSFLAAKHPARDCSFLLGAIARMTFLPRASLSANISAAHTPFHPYARHSFALSYNHHSYTFKRAARVDLIHREILPPKYVRAYLRARTLDACAHHARIQVARFLRSSIESSSN